MKHPSTRAFLAYWDEKRAGARAPDRSEIEPGAVRELLGDIFVLSYDAAAGYPFRVAGTRVCALVGRDLKDRSFSALFTPGDRREIENVITVVSEEMLAAVAGIPGGIDEIRCVTVIQNRRTAVVTAVGVGRGEFELPLLIDHCDSAKEILSEHLRGEKGARYLMLPDIRSS